jgi:hypothetical protein
MVMSTTAAAFSVISHFQDAITATFMYIPNHLRTFLAIAAPFHLSIFALERLEVIMIIDSALY